MLPAKCFRRCHKKNARMAAIVGTPTPMPTPRPIFSSLWEGEEGGVMLDAGLDAGLDVMFGAGLEVKVGVTVEMMVFGLSVVELDIPTVAARVMRPFIAQHTSEAIFAPQHQLPSVEHCDMAMVLLAFPPSCSH